MLIHLSENYVVSINYSKNSTRSKLFQGPHIGAKGILEYYLYFFAPKISQDFPTKDSSVKHKENNVETRKKTNDFLKNHKRFYPILNSQGAKSASHYFQDGNVLILH